jgi:hypothetical protein
MALFSNKPPIRVIGADAFGPQLTLEEVQAAFSRGLENPAIRAIGKICLAMRENWVGDSLSSLSQELPMQGALHSGSANACAEIAQIIADLSVGNPSDSIKKWFA